MTRPAKLAKVLPMASKKPDRRARIRAAIDPELWTLAELFELKTDLELDAFREHYRFAGTNEQLRTLRGLLEQLPALLLPEPKPYGKGMFAELERATRAEWHAFRWEQAKKMLRDYLDNSRAIEMRSIVRALELAIVEQISTPEQFEELADHLAGCGVETTPDALREHLDGAWPDGSHERKGGRGRKGSPAVAAALDRRGFAATASAKHEYARLPKTT